MSVNCKMGTWHHLLFKLQITGKQIEFLEKKQSEDKTVHISYYLLIHVVFKSVLC